MALVLVVDDEPSFRFMLKALFEMEGHEVVTGRNAKEALAHVRARTPDLITLDVMMPAHGGLEMYRTIKGREEWRHIPVIMLSGVKREAYDHALAMSGAAGENLPEPHAYMEKPPQRERLLELARAVLGPPGAAQTETQGEDSNGPQDHDR